MDGRAVICAIAKDEEPYVREWIAYHLKLGFEHIYIYDNGNVSSVLEGVDAVTTIKFPGACMQMAAYSHFVHNAPHQGWCAFIDVDEFIVLKKHRGIVEFLTEHCPDGAVALNWRVFGSNGHAEYVDAPVTRRFTRRGSAPDQHVKCIARLEDAVEFRSPHYPVLKDGKRQRDTSGREFTGPFNPDGPCDVACIHHYFTKSAGEFARKVQRGRADTPEVRSQREFEAHDLNDVEDMSAWDFFTS